MPSRRARPCCSVNLGRSTLASRSRCRRPTRSTARARSPRCGHGVPRWPRSSLPTPAGTTSCGATACPSPPARRGVRPPPDRVRARVARRPARRPRLRRPGLGRARPAVLPRLRRRPFAGAGHGPRALTCRRDRARQRLLAQPPEHHCPSSTSEDPMTPTPPSGSLPATGTTASAEPSATAARSAAATSPAGPPAGSPAGPRSSTSAGAARGASSQPCAWASS